LNGLAWRSPLGLDFDQKRRPSSNHRRAEKMGQRLMVPKWPSTSVDF
jgi:hypothetical protein